MLCVIVAGVCLFSGKTEKPISDMFAVCGAGGGPSVGSVVVRALFIACKLCWDYNLRAFCTVLKLYSVCLPRMQTGRFPEDKSQSCRFGQLCRGLWARTRDVHWTHWQTSIYFYADADVLLINLSSSTYIPTCKDRP